MPLFVTNCIFFSCSYLFVCKMDSSEMNVEINKKVVKKRLREAFGLLVSPFLG